MPDCRERIVRIQLCKIDYLWWKTPVKALGVWILRIRLKTAPFPFPFPFSVNGPGIYPIVQWTPDVAPLKFKCYSRSSVLDFLINQTYATNSVGSVMKNTTLSGRHSKHQSENFHLEKYSSVRKITSSQNIQPNVNVHKVSTCWWSCQTNQNGYSHYRKTKKTKNKKDSFL